jgi:uncharacterized protein YcbK (DUF882 family)
MPRPHPRGRGRNARPSTLPGRSRRGRTRHRRHPAHGPGALTAIDHLLRDHRTAQTHRIDPALLDILWEVGGRTRARAPYQVICGYRSPATNSMLARRSSGVARRSLHMDGRAVDIRLPGVRTSALRDTAIAMRRGGVGYYRSSNFVHLDTGAFRTW